MREHQLDCHLITHEKHFRPGVAWNIHDDEIKDLQSRLLNPARLSYKIKEEPWLVWRSGLNMGVGSKRLMVRFSIKAHAWVSAGLIRTPARSVRRVVAETRQMHMDYQVMWRKRDGMATISRGECLGYSIKRRMPRPVPWQAFIAFLSTLHWGWSSFTMHRIALGGYLL